MGEFIAYVNDVESGICLRINRLSHRIWIRRGFSLVSRLGDGGFWVLMALALYWMKGQAAIPMIVQMAVTAAAGLLLYRFLKKHLVRERPYVNHGGIFCGTAPLDRYSFPSGHTLHAVSFMNMLWAFEPALLVLAAPFTILVAASRVILGLHYPSDVIVGAVIGAALAGGSLLVF